MADIVFNSREEANAVIDYVDGWLPKADEEVAEASKKNRKAWLFFLLAFAIVLVLSILLASVMGLSERITGTEIEWEEGAFWYDLTKTVIILLFWAAWIFCHVCVIKLVGMKGLSALWPNKESALGKGVAGALGAGVGALAGVLSGVGGFGGLGAAVIGIFWKPLAFVVKFFVCIFIPPFFVTAVKSHAKSNKKVMKQVKAEAEKFLNRFPAV